MSGFSDELVTLLPRMRRVARTLASSRDAADDLVQEACARALRGAAGFTPGTRLDHWVLRILRNAWIDERRRFGSAGGMHEPIENADTVPGAEGSNSMYRRLELGEVEAALLRLPAEQREAVALICIEQLSYQEAAELTGLPAGTLMSRLSRARVALSRATSEPLRRPGA